MDPVATTDLDAFREAVKELDRGAVEKLRAELAKATEAEPTERQRTVGVPLVARMTTPASVLLRQVRLEKLRILDQVVGAPPPSG